MFKEIAPVGRQPSDRRDAAVGLLFGAGGMLSEKAGDVVIEDYRLVDQRGKRTGEKTAAGAAAADAHLIVHNAVDHRMFTNLQLQNAAFIYSQRHLFFIAQLGHRLYDIHSVGALYLIHAAENKDMRTVLLGSNDADHAAIAADESPLVADMGVGVDFHHHRAVRDRGLCNYGDDVKVITLFRDYIGRRLIIRICRARAYRGDDRFHYRDLLRRCRCIRRDLQRPYEDQLAVFVAEPFARSLFSLRNTAFDAAITAKQRVLGDGVFRQRAGFAVFDAGDAVNTVVIDDRLLIDYFDSIRRAYLFTCPASHALADFNFYHFFQLL